jgi:hypothetical protein
MIRLIRFTLCLLCCCLISFNLYAQEKGEPKVTMKKKFTIKAGPNFLSLPYFSNTTQTFSGSTGFFAGSSFSVPGKHIGYRTEIIYSRQRYDFRSAMEWGNVTFNYLMLPQLITLNVGRRLQFHAGGQVAILLNANRKTSGISSVPDLTETEDYFNRLNYGFAGGLEVKPVAGLLIGGRYNLFFNMLKENQTVPEYMPSLSGNDKNGLVQLYVGYQF